MIPIFDLDDTLYFEHSYVVSGFTAVASMLEKKHGLPKDESKNKMLQFLSAFGRGRVFNYILKENGILSKATLNNCIFVYRHHKPKISLNLSVLKILQNFNQRSYLVTDGHKIVQKNKINSLNLKPLFKKIYITHNYGLKYSKPSTFCFNLIRKNETCLWTDMFYVGDNPRKDFVNLNPLGVHTIRVLTGEYSELVAKKGYDAKYKIKNLSELFKIIDKIEKDRKLNVSNK